MCATRNLIGKDKGKVMSVHVMAAYRGSRGVATHIRDLGTSWSFFSRKEILVPKNNRCSGPHSRSGGFGEKFSCPLLGFESPDRPVLSLVAIANICIPSTGNGLYYNLGVPWFESRLSRRLSSVVVICSLSRTMPEYYPDQ